MSAATPLSVGVLGGGRWARVIVSVLHGLLEGDAKLHWISHHGHAANVQWLAEQKLTRVILSENEDTLWDHVGAVIIATASHTHPHHIAKALSLGLPVLSEKPYAFDTATAQTLIQKAGKTPAGVNLEFTYASYLADFRNALPQTINHAGVEWHDPWSEVRHGEVKYGDSQTPMVHDMLPHVWSIIHTVVPNLTWQPTAATYSPQAITIQGEGQGLKVDVSLSRRAQARTRKLIINNGEAILDFSTEPGTITIGGTTTQNEWKGLRPLGALLTAFLNQVRNPGTPWPTSLQACLNSVQVAEAAQTFAQAAMNQTLQTLPHDVTDTRFQALCIDKLLPQLAQQGERLRANTPDEQQAFARMVLERDLLAAPSLSR